jgi:5-methylcytosine-specific restriction protein B
MKLDITSLYFNGDTKSVGNTASWGTALGQERPDYPVSVEGGKEIVDLLDQNHIDFNPNTNPNHKANIKQLNDKIVVSSGCFNLVYVNNIEFEGPFYLLVIEETSGSHIGRKSLKYNNKIEIDGVSNEQFYQKIQNYFGEESCWFAYDISAINNNLHLSVIKVDDNNMLYEDAKTRKDHWESLIDDFINIKNLFKSYLLKVHMLKHESSANEYLKSMPKIQQWFIENGLCKNDYQIWNIRNDNSKINLLLENKFKKEWKVLNEENNRWYISPWNRWLEFIDWYNGNIHQNNIKEIFKEFKTISELANLNFSSNLTLRLIASLASKPFVILSGLSGSGKTKIAQSFAQWICESKEQYKIVPVGADWTNREPLVGYPNGLVAEEYITPDSGVIQLLMEAVKSGNENKPFFLILDEMNLSHVERYFADFLSIMESKDTIKLYTGNARESLDGLPVPLELSWPKNVFIIGTVNIDETTYMFSPKVLDRANVIEFRITETEIESFLVNPSTPDLSKLTKQGVSMAENFLSIAHSDVNVKNDKLAKELVSFFKQLQPVGAEFGYRSASEIMQLVTKLKMLDNSISDNSCLDIAIMQKLLPKLHGSRSKLVKILIALSGLCIEGITAEEFEKKFDDYYKSNFVGLSIKYPISFEKIIRMYKNVLANGFTSYAEA